jgi:hypothetical protein
MYPYLYAYDLVESIWVEEGTGREEYSIRLEPSIDCACLEGLTQALPDRISPRDTKATRTRLL